MFICFGVGGLVLAWDYPFGTPVRMGPGFFPIAVSGIVVLLGLALAVQSLCRKGTGDAVPAIEIRPILFVSLAILVFGALVEDWGLIAALLALTFVARFARREGSARELAVMMIVLTALTYVIFIYGLNLRLPLVPWR
jgi:hypothetical protein